MNSDKYQYAMKTFEEVIKESTPSLVVFIRHGEQDDPVIANNIEEIRKKYGDSVNVLRVDSSYDQRVAQNYSVTHFPTYVLVKEGEELMRESGNKTVAELSAMIDRAF